MPGASGPQCNGVGRRVNASDGVAAYKLQRDSIIISPRNSAMARYRVTSPREPSRMYNEFIDVDVMKHMADLSSKPKRVHAAFWQGALQGILFPLFPQYWVQKQEVGKAQYLLLSCVWLAQCAAIALYVQARGEGAFADIALSEVMFPLVLSVFVSLVFGRMPPNIPQQSLEMSQSRAQSPTETPFSIRGYPLGTASFTPFSEVRDAGQLASGNGLELQSEGEDSESDAAMEELPPRQGSTTLRTDSREGLGNVAAVTHARCGGPEKVSEGMSTEVSTSSVSSRLAGPPCSELSNSRGVDDGGAGVGTSDENTFVGRVCATRPFTFGSDAGFAGEAPEGKSEDDDDDDDGESEAMDIPRSPQRSPQREQQPRVLRGGQARARPVRGPRPSGDGGGADAKPLRRDRMRNARRTPSPLLPMSDGNRSTSLGNRDDASLHNKLDSVTVLMWFQVDGDAMINGCPSPPKSKPEAPPADSSSSRQDSNGRGDDAITLPFKVSMRVIDIRNSILASVDSHSRADTSQVPGLPVLLALMLCLYPTICRAVLNLADLQEQMPTAAAGEWPLWEWVCLACTTVLPRAVWLGEGAGVENASDATSPIGSQRSLCNPAAFAVVSSAVSVFVLAHMVAQQLRTAQNVHRRRYLYAKFFSALTSLRRSRRFNLPHFRLKNVENVMAWLTLRGSRAWLRLERREIAADSVVSLTFQLFLLNMAAVGMMVLHDRKRVLVRAELFDFSEVFYGQLLMCTLTISYFLLQYMMIGMSINQKYGNSSLLLTEQLNLHLRLAAVTDRMDAGDPKAKTKKEKLQLTAKVLDLAAKLLKELEGPNKISGLAMNPLLYNITRVMVLSCLSAAISHVFGFTPKLLKI